MHEDSMQIVSCNGDVLVEKVVGFYNHVVLELNCTRSSNSTLQSYHQFCLKDTLDFTCGWLNLFTGWCGCVQTWWTSCNSQYKSAHHQPEQSQLTRISENICVCVQGIQTCAEYYAVYLHLKKNVLVVDLTDEYTTMKTTNISWMNINLFNYAIWTPNSIKVHDCFTMTAAYS